MIPVWTRNITDWGKIKNVVKDALSDFLWKTYQEKSDDPADHHGSIRHEAFTDRKEPIWEIKKTR